jgi:23S rRNA (cytidine1920-2'-O)/16S rRNA (cytidine1409-2'-O)-methyltransferase
MKKSTKRLDELLVTRGLAEDLDKAQRLILAGEVSVNSQLASKPGYSFPEDALLTLRAKPRFAGRGGDKLQAAITAFNIQVTGLICLDVGASTGGFTDCLLQNGASMVYAVDVGKNLLRDTLRKDARVTVMDNTNARYLEPAMFKFLPSFATVDVSFISLTKILPAVTRVLTSGGHVVSLIKPQFEAGRREVEKGGVVRDPAIRARVVEDIRRFGTETIGLEWLGLCESPLKGPAGNVEFLAFWRTGEK